VGRKAKGGIKESLHGPIFNSNLLQPLYVQRVNCYNQWGVLRSVCTVNISIHICCNLYMSNCFKHKFVV